MKRRRIFTWHVHGSYLYYLVQGNHDWFIPVQEGRPHGYGGKPDEPHWPANLHAIPTDEVRNHQFDCILFQLRHNYTDDQYDTLSPEQRRLPRIYLEHDPPREHPTDTQHVVDDPNVLLVHVTHFNDLMWDSGRTPTRVIEHGVVVPEHVRYSGEQRRGLTVINNLGTRGRRLGADIFEQVRREIPLDLVGLGSSELGGLGPRRHYELPALAATYRFFFNPIRYTSLGLAVIEAMMVGVPIIGFATTEMATTIENGVSGYVDTNLAVLTERAHELLDDPITARHLGEGARRYALERFNIARFTRDWDAAFADVIGG